MLLSPHEEGERDTSVASNCEPSEHSEFFTNAFLLKRPQILNYSVLFLKNIT